MIIHVLFTNNYWLYSFLSHRLQGFSKRFSRDFCPQGNKRIIRVVKKSVSIWEICGTHIFQVLPVLFIHPIKKLTKHFVLSVFFLKFAPIKCKTRLTHLGQKCKIANAFYTLLSTDDIESASLRKIPLWAFGFPY